ncbi:hypothetical protein PIB30_043847, partial [Stylosanthes scabra]|nr:hypothetical protein [Stylosanthes scabra]
GSIAYSFIPRGNDTHSPWYYLYDSVHVHREKIRAEAYFQLEGESTTRTREIELQSTTATASPAIGSGTTGESDHDDEVLSGETLYRINVNARQEAQSRDEGVIAHEVVGVNEPSVVGSAAGEESNEDETLSNETLYRINVRMVEGEQNRAGASKFDSFPKDYFK